MYYTTRTDKSKLYYVWVPAQHSSTQMLAAVESVKNRTSRVCFFSILLQNAIIIILRLLDIEHLNIQSPIIIGENTDRHSISDFIFYPFNCCET